MPRNQCMAVSNFFSGQPDEATLAQHGLTAESDDAAIEAAVDREMEEIEDAGIDFDRDDVEAELRDMIDRVFSEG